MPEDFETVQMLGRWPVKLPAYRVEHCRVQPNWEEGRLLSMHAHLNPGMVLYDVGAEHGDLSALYGTWLRGCRLCGGLCGAGGADHDGTPEPGHNNGGVVLVEGSELFWPVIKATFQANRLVPLGCWAGFASDIDSPETARSPSWADPAFTRPDEYPGSGSGIVADGGWPSWADGPFEPHHGFKSLVESQQTIPNLRFDTLAERCPPPDAITIDTEGSELRVLHGAERLLREVRPLVWVSVHPTLMAHDYNIQNVLGAGDPDVERQRVLDYMRSLRYRYVFLEENHEEHFLFYPEELTDFDPWAGVEHLKP